MRTCLISVDLEQCVEHLLGIDGQLLALIHVVHAALFRTAQGLDVQR